MYAKENKWSFWKRKIIMINYVMVLTCHDPVTMNTDLINTST